jgi:hypothetical protein
VVTVALRLNYFDLKITTERLPDAYVGVDYNVVLAGVGGNEPYHWKLKSGRLPEGLHFSNETVPMKDQDGRSFQAAGGKIHGKPVQASTDTRFVVELDDTEVIDEEKRTKIKKSPTSKPFSITVKPPPIEVRPLVIMTRSLPTGLVARDYALDLSASGGVPPYRWTFKKLPPGISGAPDGRLVGRPQREGATTVSFAVEDDRGQQSTAPDLTFKVMRAGDDLPPSVPHQKLKIQTARAPVAVGGQEYELTLAATGGVAPYRWAARGTLPDGLSVTEDGRITGVPMRPGTSTVFTVIVRNRTEAPFTEEDSKALTITVVPPPRPGDPLRIF